MWGRCGGDRWKPCSLYATVSVMRQQGPGRQRSTLERSTRPCPRCNGAGSEKYVDGLVLRHAREKAGVSLRQMARELSLSAMYLSDVERNHRSATEYIVEMYQALLLGS